MEKFALLEYRRVCMSTERNLYISICVFLFTVKIVVPITHAGIELVNPRSGRC